MTTRPQVPETLYLLGLGIKKRFSNIYFTVFYSQVFCNIVSISQSSPTNKNFKFRKKRNANGCHDDPALDGDANGRLVAVVVVAEGEDVEALPVGPAHAPLHAAAKRLSVEWSTSPHRHVRAAHYQEYQLSFT